MEFQKIDKLGWWQSVFYKENKIKIIAEEQNFIFGIKKEKNIFSPVAFEKGEINFYKFVPDCTDWDWEEPIEKIIFPEWISNKFIYLTADCESHKVWDKMPVIDDFDVWKPADEETQFAILEGVKLSFIPQFDFIHNAIWERK
jgi:hypothetical protein